MIYLYIYILIAFCVSTYVVKQLNDNKEQLTYFWNTELDEETREMLIQHPWLVPCALITLGLLWPLLIIEYINFTNYFNNNDNNDT